MSSSEGSQAKMPGNYVAPFNGERPSQSTFRGTWQPVLYKPAFNAFQFLPTPPPQQPRRKGPEPAPAAAAAAAPPPEEPKEEQGELLTEPPIPRSEVLFSVRDREKDYRACVAKDGTCTNNRGAVIGYINFETAECGSAKEEYLGAVLVNRFDNVCQVRDAADEICGWIDMGTATIRDANGATVADLQTDGIVIHPTGTYLGQFEGLRGFHYMKECALYLMLLDPGMLSHVSG